MEDCLKDLEYYSSIHHCFVLGEVIGIEDEDSYVMKNYSDSNEEICEAKNIRKITNISSNPLNEGSICEYIKNNDEFLEVEKKEQKGAFFVLEIEDEEGNISTILSRKKQLRYIEYILFEDYIKEKYVNVSIAMPPELTSWIESERFNDIIKRIKNENSGETENYKVFYNLYPRDLPKYIRILCDFDKKELARVILSTAMEKEKKLIVINRDKEISKNQLEDFQRKNQTVYINSKFIGLIIGKEGANIKNLKNKYGVNITIDQKKNDKKLTKVIISGDNGDKVEECGKEINVVEKIYEIPESSVGDFKKKLNKFIEDYKIKYFYVGQEEKKDEEGNVYKAPNVTIIGNNEYIEELYNKEIKDYDSYKSYGNDYYSSNTYRSNYRYNNNKNYYNNYNNYNQNNYKYNNKSYSRNNYY